VLDKVVATKVTVVVENNQDNYNMRQLHDDEHNEVNPVTFKDFVSDVSVHLIGCREEAVCCN